MVVFSCFKPLTAMSEKMQPHGRYSTERLRRLKNYTDHVSSYRLLSVCLLTSLPCVALATLVESAPLAPPEAGPYRNVTFWIRAWLVMYFVNYSTMTQISQSLARLEMEHRYIVAIALVGSIISSLVLFAMAVWVAFPVPFSMLTASPPSIIIIVVSFAYVWGHRWRAEYGLRHDLARHMMVYMWQVALTLIYPLYIFGFNSLTGIAQTAFVLLLPTFKAVGEAWISYALGDQNDIKPEIVIFNVEVFNALYVSCAVQNSSSPATTAAIMLVDVLHFWFAMTGTMGVFGKVKNFMEKIPPGHPLAGASFVEIAQRLLVISDSTGLNSQGSSKRLNVAELLLETAPTFSRSKGTSIIRDPTRPEATAKRLHPFGEYFSRRVLPRGAHVYPQSPAQRNIPKTVSVYPERAKELEPALGLEAIFTCQERASFINTTARVLYITEYLVLVEYTEAVLPLVYALYMVIAFHLPNKIYIQSFDGLSSQELYTKAGLVLAYSMLELTSLVAALVILKRVLGVSSLHQLGFVLETQATMIQSKLMLWFVYVTQVPLVHVGTDFSFKFKWANASASK